MTEGGGILQRSFYYLVTEPPSDNAFQVEPDVSASVVIDGNLPSELRVLFLQQFQAERGVRLTPCTAEEARGCDQIITLKGAGPKNLKELAARLTN